MATRSERDTTRARANMLRHFFTKKVYGNGVPVTEEEVKNVLDLCLSCKACKSECPSSVDVAKMKAEFTQSYYDKHGIPFRSKLIGNFSKQMKLATIAPWGYNFIFKTNALRRVVNKLVGFHPDRTMPLLHKTTLRNWYTKHKKQTNNDHAKRTVYLLCDEFTNYNDVVIGQKAMLLLEALGYDVIIPEHTDSGRTYLSKGMVKKAKEIAIENVNAFKDIVTDESPIIGIEPSAILTLRDEYTELVPSELKAFSKKIAQNSFLFEEWFAKEIERGNIDADYFRKAEAPVYIHGHCYQKSLSSTKYIKRSLSLIADKVDEIPSGCCGMAGAFGYEKEHYEVSMKIGGLVLFPTINQLDQSTIIAASGTSCRHQIKDGTGRKAKHTAEILFDALIQKQ
jgi:Fe-S oxidoreductase